jgi:citronellol/citronellal dehydrogenase
MNNNSWKGKTAFISGASRGIGLAIAKKLAVGGANIIIAAKTVEPHPKLEGTIYSAAKEIEELGGRAFPIQTDIRDEEQVARAVEAGLKEFGSIDALVNNASAIQLTPIEHTEVKRYDLMQQVNVRGAFLCVKYCLPHLKKGNNPHILTLSPPISLDEKWFENYSPYTLSKYGMTLLTLGMAAEFRQYGIAANCLWPKTTIATAAVRNLLGGESMINASRKPEIVADAAWFILSAKTITLTGQTLIDEEVLGEYGVSDLEKYRVDPNEDLMPDLFVD